jgi:hypothetical protein
MHALLAKIPGLKEVKISKNCLNLLNFILSLLIGTGSGDHSTFTLYSSSSMFHVVLIDCSQSHQIDCITLKGHHKDEQSR